MKNLEILTKLAGYTTLNAVATDAGVSYISLSATNTGRRPLSKKMKFFLSEKLGVREIQIELFLSLTEAETLQNARDMINNIKLNPKRGE